ncbi:MAG: hypothetical protein ACXAEN_24150 [Candidatus Thorarchaeota archaeon]
MMVEKKKLKPFFVHLAMMRSPDFEEYDFSCGVGYRMRVGSMYRKQTKEEQAEQKEIDDAVDVEGEVAHLHLLRTVMEEGEKYDFRATERVYKMYRSNYEELLDGRTGHTCMFCGEDPCLSDDEDDYKVAKKSWKDGEEGEDWEWEYYD